MEPEIYARRMALWDTYHSAFSPLAEASGFTTPSIPQHCGHNAHMYYLLLSDAEVRQVFIQEMRAKDVATPFHYVPLHSSPAGKTLARAHGNLPVTDSVSERLVRLPMYFDLAPSIEQVIESVLRCLKPTS